MVCEDVNDTSGSLHLLSGLGYACGGLIFSKVAGLKPVALLENELLCGCFLRILPKF